MRTYNIQAMSFTPSILERFVKQHVPDFEMTYRPDERQAIGTYCGIAVDKLCHLCKTYFLQHKGDYSENLFDHLNLMTCQVSSLYK